MNVWYWQNKYSSSFDCIVLWDGENTYWGEHMIPSGGYKKMRTKWCPITQSRFVYIGEL